MKGACHSDLPLPPSAGSVRSVPAWPPSTWRSERLTESPGWRPFQSTAGWTQPGCGWETMQERPLHLLPMGEASAQHKEPKVGWSRTSFLWASEPRSQMA